MNRPMWVYLLALAAGVSVGTGARVSSAAAQSDDRVQIAGVVRDYFEGWYTADAERLGRSLHPDMVKRYVEAFPGRAERNTRCDDRDDTHGWWVEDAARAPEYCGRCARPVG
jgi:hypothetical protein